MDGREKLLQGAEWAGPMGPLPMGEALAAAESTGGGNPESKGPRGPCVHLTDRETGVQVQQQSTLLQGFPLPFVPFLLLFPPPLALPLGHGKGRFSPGLPFPRDQGHLVTRRGLSTPPPPPGLSPDGLLLPFPPRISPEEVFVPKQYFQGNLHSWVVGGEKGGEERVLL